MQPRYEIAAIIRRYQSGFYLQCNVLDYHKRVLNALENLHPHIHYIVPAGGIDRTGNWRHTRSGGKYLFPVKAMSSVFRGKFVALLKTFLQSKEIEFSDELRHAIYRKEWVVYAKRPFGGAGQVIEYLGRYTHKIAISNHRIQSIDHGNVTFSYKDYGESGKVKTMTLSSTEFLRRFCLHILPKGFRKIRHYGLLSSFFVLSAMESQLLFPLFFSL
jgi:hypothetical protein